MKKVLLSGIQPSGKVHIGNYFGAIKQFIDLAQTHESYVFIANYHALNTIQDGKTLRENTLALALDYLAAGLDPEKTTLFVQSDVPEVTELAWIFDCLTTMPYLARAHAFKDAAAKQKEVSIGLFNYPMLMAADILIQDTDVVPVGADQKQHVEIARDTAEKFNRIFGNVFKLPEPLIREGVAVVPGTDGKKMSKSHGNTIPLFATLEEIKRSVMSIPTDSKGIDEPKDTESALFALHRLFGGKDLPALEKRYQKGGIGYHESKEILVANMEKYIASLRERRNELGKDMKGVEAILKKGATKARARAALKMKQVREKVGLL